MPTTKSRTPSKGLIFIVIFALPFFLAGLFIGAELVSTVTSYLKIQSWEEVPATVVRVDLKHDDEGTVEYQYRYQGKDYTGNKVNLDGIQFLKKAAIRGLREHQKSGQPLPCYIDSEHPDQAILYRNAPWQSVFLLGPGMILFGGVGLVLPIGCFVVIRQQRKEEQLAQAHPNEPWLWKTDWAEGRIHASNKAFIALFVIGGFSSLFCIPFASMFIGDWVKEDQPLLQWGVIAFLLVALCLIAGLIFMVIRWRNYGRSVVELASVPGVIGGQLAGVIHCPCKVYPKDTFCLTLRCIQTTHEGGEASQHIRWENEQLIAHDLLQDDPHCTAIPVLFAIPYECCSTGKRSSTTGKKKTQSTIAWYLEVKTKTAGFDYQVKFEVPVFRTPQSDPHFTVDPDLLAQYLAPEEPQRDLCAAGVIKTISPTGDADRFIFPMARQLGIALPLTTLMIVFSPAPFLLFYFDPGWFAIFFAVIFGLFSLLLAVFLLDLWFYRSVIDASPCGLMITAGLFGGSRRRWIEADQIAKIKTTSNLQSDKQKFYDIVVVCKNRKRLTIAKRIPGNRLTTSIIRQIEQSLVGPDSS